MYFQFRTLVDKCINPDPDKRPDVGHVFNVAQEMHQATQSNSACSSALSTARSPTAIAFDKDLIEGSRNLERIRLKD